MSEISARPIIVGVSEPGESEGAVRYAVDEALRQGCGITVVHALSASLPPPPGDPLIQYRVEEEKSRFFADQSKSAEADRLVLDTAHRARAMSDGRVEVDTGIPVGHKVHAIIAAAEDAQLIVLQHRDLPIFERIFVRSTSSGVSARAHCPVVTVPPNWDPYVLHNRVTVGVEHLEKSAEVLRIAFENAARRMATLDVVHASNLMSADWDIYPSQAAADEWQTRSEKDLEELLAPWKREFPRVPVEQHVVQQNPVDSLLERSQGSDLLVLGRFRAALPLPLPLGSVARAMFKGAHCPVEIVPHASATTESSGVNDDHETDIGAESTDNHI